MTTDGKKSILIVSSVMPYPVVCGGSHALFHIINRLRSQYKFTLCAIVPPASLSHIENLKTIWNDVEIIPYCTKPQSLLNKNFLENHAALHKLLSKIKTLFRKAGLISKDSDIKKYSRLYRSFRPLDPEFIACVKNIIETHPFDLIQVEFPDMLPLADALPSTVPNLFIHHEIAYIRAERELALFHHPGKEDSIRLQQLKTAELGFLKKFNHIIVLSETDKHILESQLKRSSIFTSPAAIDLKTDLLPREENRSGLPCNLIAIGSESHYPNADGLDWFISKVWPLLIQKNPNVKLYITGKWSEPTMNRLKKRQIIFTGFVENLNTLLSNSILVVPIRIGSGMRMKIIEAVSMHVPFVTTSTGVEGLNFKHGVDCLVADNPAALSSCIELLLNDQDEAKRLAENAFLKLKNKYSFESAVQKRTAIYERILNS